jgi:hypothetical protein
VSSNRPASASAQLSRIVLLVSVVVTVALYALPLGRALSIPFVWLSTLAHELGHGLAALAVGGTFSSLALYSDGSGMALTAAAGRLARALVAAGGLIGPSLGALVFFVMGKTPGRARFWLGLTGLGLLFTLVMVVQSGFGQLFIAVLTGLCLLVASRKDPRWSQLLLVFSGTQLALSVYSRGDYLFTPVAHTSAGTAPSDVAVISEALLLPYWLWGCVCVAVSVAVLVFGLRYYWRE